MLPSKTNTNQRKAIAYIRVSSQRQVDEGVSIQAQKRRILEYVRYKKLNLANDDIIIEEGVSGGIPLWDRPKGRILQRRLVTGQYTDIVTMKLDRMFRLTTDVLTTIDELNDADIDLHIVDLNGEAVDTSTTMGRFFLTLMGALAEMERGLISERTTEAMNQLRATNKQFTKSIYGWDVNADGMFIPNWIEQDIIDYMAWQVEVNGMATAAVARSLNKRGITGKRGGKWQGNSITRTIGNDFHTNRLKFTAPDWWGSKPWHRQSAS
jgi:site-specific DNA recombinase